jgi:PHD/YefM family antitoxin component YafN of YafNO toxin-antitoxin module
MIKSKFTTIREITRHNRKLKNELEKTGNAMIVVSRKEPQFVLISLKQYEEMQKAKSAKAIDSLFELAAYAKENNISGPPDLSENLDEYVWGNKK